jgi:hypothetical protein
MCTSARGVFVPTVPVFREKEAARLGSLMSSGGSYMSTLRPLLIATLLRLSPSHLNPGPCSVGKVASSLPESVLAAIGRGRSHRNSGSKLDGILGCDVVKRSAADLFAL